jgi:hypothetical protein
VLKRLHRQGFRTADSTLEDPKIPITPEVLKKLQNDGRDGLSWITDGIGRTPPFNERNEETGELLNPNFRELRQINESGYYKDRQFDQLVQACLHLLAINAADPEALELQDGIVWAQVAAPAAPVAVPNPEPEQEQPTNDNTVNVHELRQQLARQA